MKLTQGRGASFKGGQKMENKFTVNPVYNEHPRDPKIVAVVDRWSLFRGHLCSKNLIWDL